MLYPNLRVNKHLPAVGELDELCLVFLELLEGVLIDQDRVLSVTCVVEDVCFHQQRCGGDGTFVLARGNVDMLLVLLWQVLP
jgi:hypothetical protein